MRLPSPALLLALALAAATLPSAVLGQHQACMTSYATVSDSAGSPLFKVAATDVHQDAQLKVYKLSYGGSNADVPTAIIPLNAGLSVSAPSQPTAVCSLPDPGPKYATSYTIIENGRHLGVLHASSLLVMPAQNVVFNNVNVQPNAFLTLSLLQQNPIAIVRRDSYCALGVNCTTLATSRPGTCGTIAAYDYPTLTLKPGTTDVYTGRFKMWPPIDNEDECSVRQLVFNVPAVFVSGTQPIGSANSPVLNFVVHPKSGLPAMPVSGISRQPNGPYVLYTVDAQIEDGSQINGTYEAEIMVTGQLLSDAQAKQQKK